MKVNETFVSLQGEGQTIGYPAYFIRTAGCNLRCPDCDTKYSFDEKDSERTLTELVNNFNATGLNTIVMTGGEPLIQWPEIWKFFNLAKPQCMIIETNGTICPSASQLHSDMHFVVSPKFPLSGLYKDTICALFLRNICTELKILFFEQEQLHEARNLLHRFKFDGIELQRPITFQPGIPPDMQDEEIPAWLVHLFNMYMECQKDFPPSRFITQQHKWMWSQRTRGV